MVVTGKVALNHIYELVLTLSYVLVLEFNEV